MKLKTLKELTNIISATDYNLVEGSQVPEKLAGKFSHQDGDMKIHYPYEFNATGEWVRITFKKEAIKWVKSTKIDTYYADDWIKHFFNITKEDLKEVD